MERGRQVFLDGMRGWAAVFVVLYHLFCDVFSANAAAARELRLFLPFNGATAVNAFFVISGFALSAAFLARRKRLILIRIALGRYIRLAFPILAACAIVHLLLVFHFVLPPEQRPASFSWFLAFQPTLSHLLRFGLFDVFSNYSGLETYITPLWTMPIELKGSFLVLGLLLLVGDRRWRWLIYAALLGGFMASDSFYCLFIAGICLAEFYEMGAAEWSGVRSGAIGLLLLGAIAPFFLPWEATWAAFLCGAVALCAGVVFCPMARRLMETRVSAFFGWISFPLYLMHGPVILVVGFPLLKAGYGPVSVGVLLLPVSFCAAIAFAPVNDLAVGLSRYFGTAVILLAEMAQRRIKLAN